MLDSLKKIKVNKNSINYPAMRFASGRVFLRTSLLAASLHPRPSRQGLREVRIKVIPQNPGVYIFWNKEERPIYIGKALNLKNRVASYFLTNLSSKTARMIREAKYCSIIKVSSELEALLLEANLVRKLQPIYNSQLKDDKHPLYIKITKEKYPQVLTARKADLKDGTFFFGPYPSSRNVKSVLKMLRPLFPYAEHKIGNKECLYSQIGLCYPCPNYIENIKDEKLKKGHMAIYKKNIGAIRKILSGGLHYIRKSLKKEMEIYSKKEDFENAKVVRDQIQKLDYITQPITPINEFLKNPNFIEDTRRNEINSLETILYQYISLPRKIRRIECYDIAHLAGSSPTASMTTFVMGEPEKSLYRHFRISQTEGNDLSSLRETIKRRSKYFDASSGGWGMPDLILVDGGKTQVRVFWEELKKYEIPVLGLAKRFETLVIPQFKDNRLSFIQLRLPNIPAKNLLQRIRDEAHRFARRYHHKLVQRELLLV